MRNIAILLLILGTGGVMMKLLTVFPADAAVSGPCPKCHTMHNSQNDAAQRLSGIKDTSNKYAPSTGAGSNYPECKGCHSDNLASLLKIECMGCHAQAPTYGSELIIDNTPQVITQQGRGLAAGNYRAVYSDPGKGHNAHGLGIGADASYAYPKLPPGYLEAFNPSIAVFNDSGNTTMNQIMCAGQHGCHGNRNILDMVQAMAGTHHEDDSVLKYGSHFNESLQGTTVGRSYRFLNKVKGIEDADWQFTRGNDDHNEYLGATYSQVNDSSQNDSNISTISQFCAECHGIYHARYNSSGNDGIGANHAWLRHPSDVVIPNSGEYNKYTNYDVNVPVGRPSLSAIAATGKASATVTPGTDTVICLSCHMAHGSYQLDLLRWSYSLIYSRTSVPNGTACFTCHSEKD